MAPHGGCPCGRKCQIAGTGHWRLTDAGTAIHSALVETVSHLRKRDPVTIWMKRLAAAGFLVFLVKGLVWVGIGLVVVVCSL